MALGLACEGDRSIGPPAEVYTSRDETACGSHCVLADNSAVLASAVFRPDSAALPADVGEVLVSGAPGTDVTVRLEADPGLLHALAGKGRLIVGVAGAATRTIPFADLVAGAAIHRFTGAAPVRIRYALARDLPQGLSGAFRLVQTVSDGAVLERRTPWARPSRTAGRAARDAAAMSAACVVPAAPSSTVCGITVTLSPVAPADHFGATFQSQPGSGPSQTIVAGFSTPGCASVTVTIYDPDYPGNRVVAYDAAGNVVASAEFAGDNTPGQLTVETQTLRAQNIRRVDLIPSTGVGDGDYVAYDMSFEPAACPPTGDPIMDQPGWRSTVIDLLSSADRSKPPGARSEEAAYVIRDDATGAITFEPSPATATCWGVFVSTADRIQRSLPPGKTLIGIVHSHVFFRDEDVSSCREGYDAYNPDDLGGGSRQDWEYVNDRRNSNIRVYAVSPERIHYLERGRTDKLAQEANNATNGYDNAEGCATRSSGPAPSN